MNARRQFVGRLVGVLPVAAAIVTSDLPRIRIVVGSARRGDLRAWLDGAEITCDIPIRNERRLRRAKPGQILTFTRNRRDPNGAPYLEGDKVAADVVRAQVIA